jgi:type III pantothenate kinase
MSLTLTLDQGNSSTKVVLYDAETAAEVDATTLRGASLPTQLVKFIGERQLAGAIACAVGARCIDAMLDAATAPLKMELTHSTEIPLRNAYSTPETLGMDRLAAAVGAATLFPGEDLLVADIGTACTYDVVTADATYAGGNIAPGPGMRLRALHHFTARLPLVNGHTCPAEEFGTDTDGAMRAGALRGVAAEILYYSTLGRQRRVVLSGGWAPEIADLLPAGFNVGIFPHLVNLGLNKILQHNLSK